MNAKVWEMFRQKDRNHLKNQDYFIELSNPDHTTYLSYKEVKRFTDIVSYRPSKEHSPYFFFDAFFDANENNKNPDPFAAEYRRHHFFMVSLLSISRLKESKLKERKLKEHKNAAEMMSYISDKIADECLATDVYACLGSADLLLISRCQEISPLFELRDKISSLPETRLLNSIFMVHTSFDGEFEYALPNRYLPPSDGQKVTSKDDINVHALEQLKLRISKKIPLAAKRTLEVLIDKCGALDGHQECILGKRTYTILLSVMDIIDKCQDKIPGQEILTCLSDINNSVTNASAAECFDMQTIAPVAKFFCAYENITRKIYKFMDMKNHDSIFFLTINPGGNVASTNYLGKGARQRHVYNINLPDVSYFNPKSSAAYIAHEIGHYINTGHEESELYKNRNRAMLDLLNLDIKNFLRKETSRGIGLLNLVDKRENFEEFLDLFLNACGRYDFDFGWNNFEFSAQCTEYITILRASGEKYANIILENADNNEKTFYAEFCLALRMLELLAREKVNRCREIIREARADIMMCSICGFDIEKYIKTQYRFINENIFLDVDNDYSYTIRFVAVLMVLAEDRDLIGKLGEIDLRDDEIRFLNVYINYWRRNRDMVEILVAYLKNAKSYADNKLNSEENIENIETVRDTLRLFRELAEGNRPPITAVKILYNEWYEGVGFWEDSYD